MRGIDGGQKEAASAPPGQVAPGEMEWLHPCPRPSLTQLRRRSERWRRSGLKWRCCSRTFSSSRWERLLRWLTNLFYFFFFFFVLPPSKYSDTVPFCVTGSVERSVAPAFVYCCWTWVSWHQCAERRLFIAGWGRPAVPCRSPGLRGLTLARNALQNFMIFSRTLGASILTGQKLLPPGPLRWNRTTLGHRNCIRKEKYICICVTLCDCNRLSLFNQISCFVFAHLWIKVWERILFPVKFLTGNHECVNFAAVDKMIIALPLNIFLSCVP